MSNGALRDLYADISASLLALCSALEKHNVLTNADIREAAQERLLTLTLAHGEDAAPPFVLLRQMAVALPSRPDESQTPL